VERLAELYQAALGADDLLDESAWEQAEELRKSLGLGADWLIEALLTAETRWVFHSARLIQAVHPEDWHPRMVSLVCTYAEDLVRVYIGPGQAPFVSLLGAVRGWVRGRRSADDVFDAYTDAQPQLSVRQRGIGIKQIHRWRRKNEHVLVALSSVVATIELVRSPGEATELFHYARQYLPLRPAEEQLDYLRDAIGSVGY